MRTLYRGFVYGVLACFMLAHAMVSAQSAIKNAPSELIVWTYDSFISEWGPAPRIAAAFSQKTGAKLRFVSKGDAGMLLASLLDSVRKPTADVVIGLDDKQLEKALRSGLFAPLTLKNISEISNALVRDPMKRLVPFDYGQFAFIWDSESDCPPPHSLEDLAKPIYNKKIIIMDPRTSTPGLGFLAWTQAVYKDKWQDYWKRLAPSILAMTPSWDTGYGLFTQGEAPLVLSYSTSPAYHKAYENSERFKALQFTEGHVVQIEFAGMLVTSNQKELAQQFIDFLLSAEC